MPNDSRVGKPGEHGSGARLAAGRELDALVAEKVMGWTSRGAHPIFGGSWVYATGHSDTLLPNFSTDIAAAWQVVAAIQQRELGWRFSIVGGDHQGGRFFGWRARFFGHVDDWQNYGQEHGNAFAATAPLAICLAALKSVQSPSSPQEPADGAQGGQK